MNQYGKTARDHWRRWRPTEFGTIQDPEVFFSTLGETVASQVEGLADRLAGPDPAGEGYLEKVGRLNAAKRQAEELVLAELVYLTPEPGSRTTRTRTWRTTRRSGSGSRGFVGTRNCARSGSGSRTTTRIGTGGSGPTSPSSSPAGLSVPDGPFRAAHAVG